MKRPISHRYDDIIHLPRPVSDRHAHMSMIDRGAQFSPFSALTGYDAVIAESARFTDQDTDLADSGIAMLDASLRRLSDRLGDRPTVTLVWFRPDERKAGGSTVRTTGIVKRIDLYEGRLILEDGREVRFDTLKAIEFTD